MKASLTLILSSPQLSTGIPFRFRPCTSESSRIRALKPGGLRWSQPAGAEVQVDGRGKGLLPRLTNLTAGSTACLFDGWILCMGRDCRNSFRRRVYRLGGGRTNWKAVSTSLKGIKRKIRSRKRICLSSPSRRQPGQRSVDC